MPKHKILLYPVLQPWRSSRWLSHQTIHFALLILSTEEEIELNNLQPWYKVLF